MRYASTGTEAGERLPEEAAGRPRAGDRRNEGGDEKKVVKPRQRQSYVHEMKQQSVSERRSCQLIGMARSSYRYRPIVQADDGSAAKLQDIAANAYGESFNAILRRECLNRELFYGVLEARIKTEPRDREGATSQEASQSLLTSSTVVEGRPIALLAPQSNRMSLRPFWLSPESLYSSPPA